MGKCQNEVNDVIKQFLLILGLTFMVIPHQGALAESAHKPEDMYVTTEDIIVDLISPTIDERVIKEYGGEPNIYWKTQRIVGITYNDNHSYDVAARISIPSEDDNAKEDVVIVRVSPSCDSSKINKQVCNHDFNMEIVEYKHISR
ncbi:hypothetical protein D3H55_13050 [Bacillus salacetis]|uniref:DUF3888 domain-containing protein n=1 Tax=Bacillus salacetis TaxID=2315464 RepID=A0A3A1QVP9_9BACI|nr:hypothetical protein [Bacillus salacetis]RIW32508.1 hypothetical protein D3H55_13050 [Bacillus salacetis]